MMLSFFYLYFSGFVALIEAISPHWVQTVKIRGEPEEKMVFTGLKAA